MLFAASFTEFLPPLSATAMLGVVGAVALATFLLRKLLGPANAVSRRWSLWLLRGAILVVVAVILFNPVRVDEVPGPVERPGMFYLLDTSASMRMGSPRNRWQETLEIIAEAQRLAATSPALPKAFRFGQRLAAVQEPATSSAGLEARPTAEIPDAVLSSSLIPHLSSLAPNDADTRLLSALRQISSRFGRVPPLGIVVFSDGRAHDDIDLERLAGEFARLKTPIHVVPVGDVSKGGDVAVAAVVAPQRARKYTEVEVQVFLRSYGFDGKRTLVRLLEVGGDGRGDRQLASLPITLQSGFQSVSLSFRTDLSTRKLRVVIPPLVNEISDGNNQVDTEMAIDRTKLRVLYIEGSSQRLTQMIENGRYQIRGPFVDFRQALVADEDIECVTILRPNGLGRLMRVGEQGQLDAVHGFPATVAELAAFDCIVLSNVSAEAFRDEQLDWIEPWIGQRGGGLCMIGGENSFASGGWGDTRIGPMLPVELLPAGLDWSAGDSMRLLPELPATPHPIWELLADARQNRQIVGSIPGVSGLNRWAKVRTNLTTVLATIDAAGSSVAGAGAGQFTGALGAADASAFGDQNAQASALTSSTEQSTVARSSGPSEAKDGLGGRATDAATPAIVVGRYGRGRTAALAFPITAPYADDLVQRWGQGDNRYYAKFCRNLIYWITENSAIGRRRLMASADKRFYRPGETIAISAATYDESAAPTKNYRVVAMVEPHTAPGEAEPETSPLRWPSGMPRTSGEEDPFVIWGEEFELPLSGTGAMNHAVQLPLAEVLSSGTSSQSLRVELTAYEDFTQIDSTSLDIQVLHDPFEQQNPFPNHDLLQRLAAGSGGKVLKSSAELAALLNAVPADVGPPIVRRAPLWSKAWVLALLLGLLTMEWCLRRALGLA